MEHFNHHFTEPTLYDLDAANQRLACEIEFMNDIDWTDHTTSRSYAVLHGKIHRHDIPGHSSKLSAPKDTERQSFMNGALIGIELGKRALGTYYDNRLSWQLESSTNAIHNNLLLSNPKSQDMFDRIRTVGSADTLRLPGINRAVAEYSDRKILDPEQYGILMTGIGFVARTILVVQKTEIKEMKLLDLSLNSERPSDEHGDIDSL